MKIVRFEEEYAFLSNFYPVTINYNGLRFQSAEAAYQAQKCNIASDRFQFCELAPGPAKKLGNQVELRKDWDVIKDGVMFKVVQAKFTQDERLGNRLIATGDAILIEGNTWGDTYWGVCQGVGENRLGEILMQVRDELRMSLLL